MGDLGSSVKDKAGPEIPKLQGTEKNHLPRSNPSMEIL